MKERHQLERPELRLSNDECFLCQTALVDDRSDEHVFPKWLQQRYSLSDKWIVLLNGTRIPYRSLTIPCCVGCNTGTLSRLESVIGEAVAGGFQAFVKLPKETIYMWLGKLFFGLVAKEHGLPVDPHKSAIGGNRLSYRS